MDSTISTAEAIVWEAGAGRLVTEVDLPPRPADLVPFPSILDSRLVARLAESGFKGLYAHQAEAAEQLILGRDTAVATGTNSGKTLCYLLPALQACLQEPAARAFLIYPTKALAQDQLARIQALAPPGIRAAVYDGDTPKNQRSAIRSEAHLILTNPDMLHLGILPNADLWRRTLRALRVVAVDEAHTLRGAFGSHAAWVLRRLLRLAEWHGAKPVVALGSATLPEIALHAQRLTGREFLSIDEDGSPQGRKRILLVGESDEPDGHEHRGRLAGRLLASLAGGGIRTLAFCRSRIGAELTARAAQSALESGGRNPALIGSYRAGYTPQERRQIEKALFTGKLAGLAATNALEMGVDIGGLDVVLIQGYPGSVSSFWQQAGRCGRSGRDGLAVFLAGEDPLEQHLVREPGLLARSPERASIRMENPAICRGQLLCMAHERPIGDEEAAALGPDVEQQLADLADEGALAHSARRWFYTSHDPPAPKVSLRSSESGRVSLVFQGEVLSEMEPWRALREAHPGAVYLHRDQTFQVKELLWDQGLALLERHEAPWHTEPRLQSLAQETHRIQTAEHPWGRAGLCGIHLTVKTVGFVRRHAETRALMNEELLDLPAHESDTIGVCLDLSPDVLSWEDPRSAGILHAWEHALRASAPLVASCDPRDLGSAWFLFCMESMGSRVAIFDSMPGGSGFSESLFQGLEDWLSLAWRMALSCPCQDGCPRCLLLPACESKNELLDKTGLRQLAELF